jgi:hypothetical protein
MFNLYDFIGRWFTFWGLWTWSDDWRCACDIVPLPGNGGIAGIPAGFAGC